MRSRRTILASIWLTSMLACASGANSQGSDWILLGQREVTDRADHDVIPVTASRGDFDSIRLTVRRAPVDFHRVVVHYGNGSSQEIDLRSTVPAGGQTRAIDLRRDERVIRSVELWYDASTLRGRRAVVRLLGKR